MLATKVSEVTDTRSAILIASIDLFVAHGYDGVSIRQIAQQSGCNMGSISYHFGGKEKLYQACFDTFGMEELEVVLLPLNNPQSAPEVAQKLQTLILELGEFSLNNKARICLVLKEIYSQTPRVKDIKSRLYWPVFHRIETYLLAAQAKNIIRSDLNASFFVRTLLFIIQSEVIFSQNSKPNMKNISQEIMNICNRSIYV